MPALTPAQKTQLEDVVEIFIDDILVTTIYKRSSNI